MTSLNISTRLDRALERATAELSNQRKGQAHWTGNLSSSALSTATAITALSVVQRESGSAQPHLATLIAHGLEWLARHQNADGGWGDTTISLSNISTTALVWAAFGSVPRGDEMHRAIVSGAEKWLLAKVGNLEAPVLGKAISKRYGKDRTFSVPILTACALAGRWGGGTEPWQYIVPLPFELAVLPRRLFSLLRLPVVSYALPALIALGYVRFTHCPPLNPVPRLIRRLARSRALRLLGEIQPKNGGFLEAIPLTSFVVMSLAAAGQRSSEIVEKGIEFLVGAVRSDGSWPIDTNLATWVTTLSINALIEANPALLDDANRRPLEAWLWQQQFKRKHPYTDARPGGWAWTDLPGGVPDADDTAGALLALSHLDDRKTATLPAAQQGAAWLLSLQNSDGGIPTFCRGWTNLPFDRSGPDLTAHALRAWGAWSGRFDSEFEARLRKGIVKAWRFLLKSQRVDGSWIPLWFGNQHRDAEDNPSYGTARVLLALAERFSRGGRDFALSMQRGAAWLIDSQHQDGSWGESESGSMEETACALSGLAAVYEVSSAEPELFRARVKQALDLGASWLIEQVEQGTWKRPSPIGFYFARLWYFEECYPLIFTVEALGRIKKAKLGE